MLADAGTFNGILSISRYRYSDIYTTINKSNSLLKTLIWGS